MSKKAVDIVLGLPVEITKLAVDLNTRLGKKQDIVLHPKNCVPHISLCMGVMKTENKKEIEQALDDIASHVSPLHLTIKGTKVTKSFNGKSLVWLVVEKSNKLQSLHNIIMTRMSSFLTHDASASHFLKSSNGLTSSIKWVNNYAEDSAFDKFQPHITVGEGKLTLKKSHRFTTDSLLLTHLGSSCTCKKVLKKFTLRHK